MQYALRAASAHHHSRHLTGLVSLAIAWSLCACNTYNTTLVNPPSTNGSTQDGGMANAGTGAGSAGTGGSGGTGGTGGAGGAGGAGGTGGSHPGCHPNPNTKNQVCPEICPETCNNKDDDCDLRIDEDEADDDCKLDHAVGICDRGKCVVQKCAATFRDCDNDPKNGCETTDDDAKNCGICGKKCTYGNAVALCVDKVCTRGDCLPGFGDCDSNPSNCETKLNTLTHCAACDLTCSNVANATASCANGYCGPGKCDPMFGDCNDTPGDGCEQQLNTSADCGKCHTSCTLPGATSECSTGVCAATSCNVGYDDCDNDTSNGCESLSSPEHCGSCDQACDTTLPNVKSATCGSMICTVKCKPGFGDCDNNPATGCETPLNTNVNCGMCKQACSIPNAVATCDSGECTFDSCSAGHDDCVGSVANDCETTLDSDTHCGSCTNVCTGGTVCSAGVCGAVDCNAAGHASDCPGSKCGNCVVTGIGDSLCETDLTTSVANCGACGNQCTFTNPATANATLACSAQGCKAVCAMGFGDCNNDYRDGCETALNTLNNCDACGTACAIPNSAAKCTTFSGGHYICEIANCATDHADCDMDNKSCEAPLNTPAHCGTCLNACNLANASEACTGTTGNWACSIAACDQPYYKDCDGTVGNGCEVDTRSDVAHCGACMNSDCSMDAHVMSATCVASTCNYNCAPGFKDCDMTAGCETDIKTLASCGGCGVTCARANAAATCSTGTCAMVPNSCTSGFADCNTMPGDGCETALKTVANCTACNDVCSVGNGVGTCASGTCQRASCATGWDDCDANPLDCERDVRAPASGGTGPCLPDTGCVKKTYTDANGTRVYYFCPMVRTWSDARAHCQQQLAGDLVRIDDAAENTFVQTNTGGDTWTGATDAAVEGAWRWIDNNAQFWNGAGAGAVVGGLYNKWSAGEPNDYNAGTPGEDCGTLLMASGSWNDANCTTTTQRFVCETQADLCPSDPTKVSPGQCGCGNPDTDTDGDLTADCNETCDTDPAKLAPGVCGCGVADTDTDGDGTKNCNDPCPTDPLKIAAGVCGCGVADTDTDHDGTPDCHDACPADMTKTVGPCGFGYTPSNFDPTPLAFTAAVTVNCNATVTSSTSVAAITICGTSVTPVVQNQKMAGGPQVFILPMASLTVASGFTLKLNGTLPVVLAVQGSTTISGTIDAGSVGAATVGAGGNVSCSPGTGGNGTTGMGDGGGGGGGFGLAGAAGGKGGGTYSGSAGSAGAAGAAGGVNTLTPLRGGCAGGKNGSGAGHGGNGGGAVQLTVGGTLTLASSAVVTAFGGGAPAAGGGATKGAGGGGSGGAILLESAQLSIDPGAWITTNGGGGGSGDSSNPGTDGIKTNTAQAPGGSGGAAGGKGGALAGAATVGGTGAFAGAFINTAGGGGGGGGVGRIRVHVAAASCTAPPTAKISPASYTPYCP